eukprot:3102538-Prymnesium_polylepis.1
MRLAGVNSDRGRRPQSTHRRSTAGRAAGRPVDRAVHVPIILRFTTRNIQKFASAFGLHL